MVVTNVIMIMDTVVTDMVIAMITTMAQVGAVDTITVTITNMSTTMRNLRIWALFKDKA